MQLILLYIELIDDPMITNTETESVHTLHAIMRKALKVPPKFVDPTLNLLLHSCRQAEKSPVKLGRIDLRRRAARRIHGRWMR